MIIIGFFVFLMVALIKLCIKQPSPHSTPITLHQVVDRVPQPSIEIGQQQQQQQQQQPQFFKVSQDNKNAMSLPPAPPPPSPLPLNEETVKML